MIGNVSENNSEESSSLLLRLQKFMQGDGSFNRDDQQFLPADLAILETPPSPVRMAFIWIICTFVVTALVWSWFGRIDIVAVAQGKIQPTGRVKVIQPLETGKVAAIRIENGARVKAGDVLIEMERGDAQAEETDAETTLASWRAEALRRRALMDAASQQRWSKPPVMVWPDDIPAANRLREEEVLASDLSQLAASVASIDAQSKQKEVERDQFMATMKTQNDLIATLQERVDMRSSLVKSGSGAKAPLIDALETMQYHQTVLQTEIGQREGAVANLEVLVQERQKSISTFIADNSQKLAEAQRQTDDFQQKLVRARLKLGRMSLTTPIDGIAMGLSVTTVGQVIGGGDELVRIVPEDATLEIECYLPNKDVGFVRPGQNAVVKIESFPFTRYGTMAAKVQSVAHDAIPEPDAQATEGNPATRVSRDNRTFAGAQRTQNLVFPVTLMPSKSSMNVDGASVSLTPGMAVSVEIATGNRRILEYVFSPLVEVASEALKER